MLWLATLGLFFAMEFRMVWFIATRQDAEAIFNANGYAVAGLLTVLSWVNFGLAAVFWFVGGFLFAKLSRVLSR